MGGRRRRVEGVVDEKFEGRNAVQLINWDSLRAASPVKMEHIYAEGN